MSATQAPPETLWARAFSAAVGDLGMQMTWEDDDLAIRLRESGRTPAYAAARVCMRITRRRRLALAGW